VEEPSLRNKFEKAVKKTVGRWSNEERKRFMQAVSLFGFDWPAVEDFVGSRTLKQITNYAIKEYGPQAIE
jgi:hypothetical protein